MQAQRKENTLSMKAEHKPDLYTASKTILTLGIAKCEYTAVERGAQSTAVCPSASPWFLYILDSFVLSRMWLRGILSLLLFCYRV